MTRLKSKIWIDALLRRLMGQGLFGALIHKGDEEAGAIFIAINRLDKTYDLLVPAIGMSQGDWLFARYNSAPLDWPNLDTYVQRQRKFDHDLWLVEIELRDGFADLNVVSD